jgi:hypothetical protein
MRMESGSGGENVHAARRAGRGGPLALSVAAAVLPKCPACLAANASVLGALGVLGPAGLAWLRPAAALVLAGALALLGWRARERRGFGPLLPGLAGAALLLPSLLRHSPPPHNMEHVHAMAGVPDPGFTPAAWAGMALLMAASLWNAWPRPSTPASCSGGRC